MISSSSDPSQSERGGMGSRRMTVEEMIKFRNLLAKLVDWYNYSKFFTRFGLGKTSLESKSSSTNFRNGERPNYTQLPVTFLKSLNCDPIDISRITHVQNRQIHDINETLRAYAQKELCSIVLYIRATDYIRVSQQLSPLPFLIKYRYPLSTIYFNSYPETP